MDKAFDLARAAVAAAAMLLAQPVMATVMTTGQEPVAQVTRTAEQAAPEPNGGNSVDPSQVGIIQWAQKEGPAYVVILVILFFYRRDWKTAVDFWQSQHAVTTKLVVDCTQSQTETSAALRENTVVVHQAKAVMQRYLPQMRDGDLR